MELADADLIDKYVASMRWRSLSETTIYVREASLRKLSREVGLRQATAESVQAWLSRPSLQPQSRNTLLTGLHCFYAWCNHEGYFDRVKDHRGVEVDFDPTAEIVKPKTKKGRPHPISESDLETALALADPLLRCWLLLGALCGCRCMEISGLTRENVHDEDVDPWIRLLGKGNKERDVPIHPDALAALRALPMRSEGRLWDDSPQAVSKTINDHLHKKVGTKSTAHALRHRFASALFQSSTDIRLTQEMLGHSSPAVTAIYAAFDQRKAAGAINKIGLRHTPPE